MDGYKATQLIRNDRKFDSLPIIALSARAMDFEKDQCRQIGMNGCINVPFNPNDLWNTLLGLIVNNTLSVPDGEPVQPDRPTGSASTIQELNSDRLDSADVSKAIMGRQNDVVDVAWIETLTDYLRKGDFNAVELWEKHKMMMTNRLSTADLELVDRALQQFDFAQALAYLKTSREKR
jgi:CheY-like chemotaxis protein